MGYKGKKNLASLTLHTVLIIISLVSVSYTHL